MGEFATTVQTHLREELSRECPALDWETEYRIEGTPVDVAGASEGVLFLVELEWRRADPADNTAKLFRHLEDGSIDHDQVHVFQVFTRYYDLASGGHSSKRKNAEFVGYTAANVSERLSYDPLDLDIDPPKRGGDWPDDWEDAAGQIVDRIVSDVR
jgi:hypothetical protein